eukprot:s445_g21.t1
MQTVSPKGRGVVNVCLPFKGLWAFFHGNKTSVSAVDAPEMIFIRTQFPSITTPPPQRNGKLGHSKVPMSSLGASPRTIKVPSRPQSARVRPHSAQSRRSEGDGGQSCLSYKGLMTRQQHHNRPASAGRRILPAELGLSGRRVLTLPSHVDNCDQGESCCWRWLAHAVLKEASWLKEDLDTLRKEYAHHMEQQTKVESSVEELAELRGAHRMLQTELRSSRDSCDVLRQELLLAKTQAVQKQSREEDLMQEVARLTEEKSQATARAEKAMEKSMETERENYKMHADVEDLKRQLLFLEDDKVRTEGLIKTVTKERDELRQVQEAQKEAAKRRKAAKAKSSAKPGKTKGRNGEKPTEWAEPAPLKCWKPRPMRETDW